MRPINKGVSNIVYLKYGDALNDLTTRIGHYCSYCEMGVNNMIEVEHVHPVANGGNELDWNNFLLSCKYCNTIKSNRNPDRTGYFWPDIDNTDLLFNYTLDNRVLEVNTSLPAHQQTQSNNLIGLVGLNRYPQTPNIPTPADKRWRLRDEALTTAKNSFNNWSKIKDDINSPYRVLLAQQIAETSTIGFYSIWYKVFEGEQAVLDEIDQVWINRFNNYKLFHIGTTNRVIRPNGQI